VAIALVEVALYFVWFEKDRQALLPLLHFLDAELEVHEPDPDPRVVLRLKPGSRGRYENGPGDTYTVSVNSLGFRGKERTAARPTGVFRIIVVGGSNVYGGSIHDDETWPHKLEERLNVESPGKYEVWNGGVSSYSSPQMVAVAEKYIEKYDPNMLIFAPSNPTPRFFLHGTPDLLSYFRRDLTLWDEILPPVHSGRGVGDRLPRWLRLGLLNYSRLGRSLLLKDYTRNMRREPLDHRCTIACVHAPYVQASREFLRAAARKTKVVVFIAPFVFAMYKKCHFEEHYQGLGLPALVLRAEGRTEEFLMAHPPVGVMEWYASNLVHFLRDKSLLPPADGDARQTPPR